MHLNLCNTVAVYLIENYLKFGIDLEARKEAPQGFLLPLFTLYVAKRIVQYFRYKNISCRNIITVYVLFSCKAVHQME
jgi:hypothetical protein